MNKIITNNKSSWLSGLFSKNHSKKEDNGSFLGLLEKEIMSVLWCDKECTVREVVGKLKNKKAYTTVMTVMDRLNNKKILKRKKLENGAYVYTPVVDEQTFSGQVSKKIIDNLLSEFGDVAVAQFIDTLENSNEKSIKEWKEKLRGIK